MVGPLGFEPRTKDYESPALTAELRARLDSTLIVTEIEQVVNPVESYLRKCRIILG